MGPLRLAHPCHVCLHPACNPAMLRLPIHPASLNLHFSYWNITNGQGLSQEVRGLGVVGQHPELAPGESFTYQSGECGHLRWLSVVFVGLRWSSVCMGRPTCLLANLRLPCNRGWQQQQAGMPYRMSGARPLPHERDLASCKRHRTLTHLFPVPPPSALQPARCPRRAARCRATTSSTPRWAASLGWLSASQAACSGRRLGAAWVLPALATAWALPPCIRLPLTAPFCVAPPA